MIKTFFLAQLLATVAMFQPGVVDPNAAVPLSTMTYQPTCGVSPKGVETPPIVNPTTGAFDDPANAAVDCRVDLSAQVHALPVGSGYLAAVKLLTTTYGALSTAFSVTAAQPLPAHPCDTTPVSPSVVQVGQAYTLGFCHNQRDTNGVTTSITAYRIYRNGTLITAPGIVTGPTPNTQGMVFTTVPRSESAPGTVTYEAAAVNGVGEGARAVVWSGTIVQPPTVPSSVTGGRVTIP